MASRPPRPGPPARRTPAEDDDIRRGLRPASPSRSTWIALGVLGVFAVGVMAVIPPWLLGGIIIELGPPLLVMAGGSWALWRVLRGLWSGRGDVLLDVSTGRPPRRRPRGGTRREAFVTLAPSTTGTPFDPSAPTHREVEGLIRTCRARDGLRLDVSKRRLTASLVSLDGTMTPLAERVVQWRRISAFLSARDDAEATWWAAIACGELHEMETTRRALQRLGPPHLSTAVTAIRARGTWPAQAAAALVMDDAQAIDRAIAAAGSNRTDVLAELLDARWAATPDPALLVRWASRLKTALALARARLPEVGVTRWSVMLESPSLDVATFACRTLIDSGSPDAVMACRVLLARRDLLDRPWASAPRIRPLEQIVEAALAHLGTCGEAEDVARLKAWRAVPRFEFEAGESLQALAEWVSDDLAVGGLTLTVDEGAAGGLSRPQERGGLSIDEPD